MQNFAALKLNITLKGHYRRSIQFWKIMQTLGPYHESKPNCLFDQFCQFAPLKLTIVSYLLDSSKTKKKISSLKEWFQNP
jgi:hypothetical protein